MCVDSYFELLLHTFLTSSEMCSGSKGKDQGSEEVVVGLLAEVICDANLFPAISSVGARLTWPTLNCHPPEQITAGR
jgi:hypothetical protein